MTPSWWPKRATDLVPPEPPPSPVEERIEPEPEPVAAPEPVPIFLGVKPKEEHQTPADTLDYLCKRFGGTYERNTYDGVVAIAMNFPDGERIVSRGKNTAEAVKKLAARLEK